MSKLRPELRNGSHLPCMTNGTAYMMIKSAVETQPGLIHGQLDDGKNHCAIGSYFNVNHGTALPESLIDEVAAVNDSMPDATPRQRKLHVLKWLRWKLEQCGLERPVAKRRSA